MKRLAIVLLILLPCLCFGQTITGSWKSKIEVTKEMKTLPEVKGNIAKETLINLVSFDRIFPYHNILIGPCPSVVYLGNTSEYEVQVLSPGYESFLATQRPKDFYTESFLKAKNKLMVLEWNFRHRQPSRYNSNIYEVSVDYDNEAYYGLDAEYRIYMFFRFMEKEHNMSLTAGRLTAQI